MEYIYAAMLIHKTGSKINEDTVKKVILAAGGKPDDGKVKAVVAAMADVDIDKAIKEAAVPMAVPTAPAVGAGEVKAEKKKEEPKEDPEKAAAGLGALFG